MCCFCLNNPVEQYLRHAATTAHPYLIVKAVALLDIPSVTSTAHVAEGPNRTRHVETNKLDEVFVDDRWLLRFKCVSYDKTRELSLFLSL